jgi:hypothetical protein
VHIIRKKNAIYKIGGIMRKSIFILVGITLLISSVSALSWSGYDWMFKNGIMALGPNYFNPNNTYVDSDGKLSWSGYDWTFKNGIMAPGPNYFNPNNAYVDSDGKLHLELNYENGRWNCVELNSVEDFTYGKYTWVVSSQSINLDRNVVLGLFTYTDNTHEIDIESAQWGDPSLDFHLQFTCQPSFDYNFKRFVSSDSSYVNASGVTYTFDWQPTYIHYTATASNGKIIADWNYTDTKGVPKVPAKVMMDLWLYKGVPPNNGEPVEVIISSFHRS